MLSEVILVVVMINMYMYLYIFFSSEKASKIGCMFVLNCLNTCDVPHDAFWFQHTVPIAERGGRCAYAIIKAVV